MVEKKHLTRREFVKVSALALGSLGLRSWEKIFSLPDFPDSERLGRVVWWGTEMKTRPSYEAQTVRTLTEDEVYPWLREVVGYWPGDDNQRWVETPEGYIRSQHLQPVRNNPNQPVSELPDTSLGEGMWVEVSVPFVDLVLDNPPARAPWLENRIGSFPPPRLYYSQIMWVDRIRTDESGQVWYRVNEKYGYGDIFWAAAEAFRPIDPEEITPINPDGVDKKIVVDVPHQSLSCFEGRREVYYCRISSGALYNIAGQRVDEWATPGGNHPIWRKLISLHMSGGTTGGGWDLPGIGWTTLFVGTGVAVHSTFWHNNFGVPMSHGCVNASPEDAKWVFRWTQPIIQYDPGEATVQLPGGTTVEVVES